MIENPYSCPVPAADAVNPASRGWVIFIKVLSLCCIVAVIVALLLPNVRRGREPAYRTQCKNNLKNITLALLSYAEFHGDFPPAYSVDAAGNPLHSWRTLILPYLDQPDLYESIDFSKPWDDPANEKAYRTSPDVFRCPAADLPTGFTVYLGNAVSGGCFNDSNSRPVADITDPHNQTLLVVEVASRDAVHWMSPTDATDDILLNFGPERSPVHRGVTNAGFVDGTVQALSIHMDASVRRALLSIAGDDALDKNKDF